MFVIEISTSVVLSFLITLTLTCSLFFISSKFTTRKSSISTSTFSHPRIYPLIGSYVAIYENRKRLNQWFAEILTNSPTGTYVLHSGFGAKQVLTANPTNVRHILKSQFHLYTKGENLRTIFHDFLGTGLINADGEEWKFQRKISVQEFNPTSLRNFINNIVKTELSNRLIPILSIAAQENTVLDAEDIFRLFSFDTICKIAYGFDPEALLPSRPMAEFSTAFEDVTKLTIKRFGSLSPLIWKLKRFLDIGSEKRLRQATTKIRDFAKKIIKLKKDELRKNSPLKAADLLSRFLNFGDLDENLLIDIVINFLIGAQDTTSAALTWFFYLVFHNLNTEKEILKEIKRIPENPSYDDVKGMVYTHASLSETMRLYPPVPANPKEAKDDDILPDGTVIKKGTRVSYHPHAMGRMETLWGKDCMEFKPERWLNTDQITGEVTFVPRDPFIYPVFQAGPRICIGKDMAFMQMKMLVAGILGSFRIVPATGKDFSPIYISNFTARMKGGFPVRIERRE